MDESNNSNQSTPPKVPQRGFRELLYGIGVFCVFMALTFLLRLIAHQFPENPILFGVFQKNDLLMGLAIAVILTYSRHLKRNIGNKK